MHSGPLWFDPLRVERRVRSQNEVRGDFRIKRLRRAARAQNGMACQHSYLQGLALAVKGDARTTLCGSLSNEPKLAKR